jgi:hypothetical protein
VLRLPDFQYPLLQVAHDTHLPDLVPDPGIARDGRPRGRRPQALLLSRLLRFGMYMSACSCRILLDYLMAVRT